ncbi:DNA repair protein xrcc2 [Geranomyces variabilis]|nr:DNA repair protein xrcc2 [Geranomyces variabilis]
MHAHLPPPLPPPPTLQQPHQQGKAPPLLLATPPELLAAVQGETALDVLTRAWRGTPVFDARASPRDVPLPRVRTGELLDLCGPLGGGKTELIMRIITLTLLPRIWTPPTHPASAPPLYLGGSNSSVLLLDSDLRFSLIALHAHLRAHVVRCLPTDHPPSESAINVLITSALTRLHLARPTSAIVLVATLARAPHTFLPNAASLTPLIVVDGLSPFYWINRLDDLGEGPHLLDPADDEDGEEAEGSSGQPQPQPQSFMHESVHRAIIRVLRGLKDGHHCAIVVSRWELFPSSSAAGDEPGGGGGGGGPALARNSDAPWAALADRMCYVWRDLGGVARWKQV